ncbi:hypothetical protein TYRP_007834, partial [Tyrophagus putrescentiae]
SNRAVEISRRAVRAERVFLQAISSAQLSSV